MRESPTKTSNSRFRTCEKDLPYENEVAKRYLILHLKYLDNTAGALDPLANKEWKLSWEQGIQLQKKANRDRPDYANPLPKRLVPGPSGKAMIAKVGKTGALIMIKNAVITRNSAQKQQNKWQGCKPQGPIDEITKQNRR